MKDKAIYKYMVLVISESNTYKNYFTIESGKSIDDIITTLISTTCNIVYYAEKQYSKYSKITFYKFITITKNGNIEYMVSRMKKVN